MKIEEQVLSREQMAHLERLGIDVTDASMAYYDISEDGESEKWILGIANPRIIEKLVVNCRIKQIAHAYTIGDLIEKLPKFFNEGDVDNLQMGALNGTGAFSVGYNMVRKSWKRDGNIKYALYKLLCWLAENHKGLIK